MTSNTNDKSNWAIAGGLLSGLGIGFFFLSDAPALAFVGSLITGLGIGIIISAILSKIGK